ncbi:GNAT family N-acetyltransferase [Pseudalkalibacillus salsuginis]|uniref:GNAT family N-acetyltransferase n=1 Tax=Pseudalkalibacillus salsuginis TaxID=2910972 RepID=UPI001F2097AE|nr:GNAT family N-acetyltransferase [Pseudalkalibacillus salsuginis]MCF6411043.1 GNAT family N-acetyltransferase [Pseudalkalibacillus salsuginis]
MNIDYKLMEIQTEVLFNIDNLKKITGLNEPTETPAPFLFIGRTKTGNIIRFNKSFSEFEESKILKLVDDRIDSMNLGKLIINVSKLRQISSVWMGPAYVFPEGFNMTSNATKITNDNKDLLLKEFPHLIDDFEWRQPIYAIMQDGKAVSICSSARKSLKGAEASVETLTRYQGNGYATRCVVAWAAEVRKLGLKPLYSTAWDNFSSQSVAKKLNLYQYGVDLHFG